MARVKLELPDKFLFSTEIPVRIGDINYGGHLGNDAVLAIAHEARVQFLGQHGWGELNIEGKSIIMADAVVVYKSQAYQGDIMVVNVTVADLTTSGCDFLFRLTNKASGSEVARVKTGIVFFDYGEHKVLEMPEKFRATFSY